MENRRSWTYCISEAPVTKKNSQQILTNRRTGKPFIMPSSKFRQYEKAARLYLMPCPKEPITYPVEVRCTFYMPTRRAVDLTNLLEAVDDILVSCGILADDNSKITVSHDGSRVRYDKLHPRTEIVITPMKGD